jgi:hypothetical protein
MSVTIVEAGREGWHLSREISERRGMALSRHAAVYSVNRLVTRNLPIVDTDHILALLSGRLWQRARLE